MRIIITNHFLCRGWAFDVAHFHGNRCVTIGGSRFYASQWRVAEENEIADKVNPDVEASSDNTTTRTKTSSEVIKDSI